MGKDARQKMLTRKQRQTTDEDFLMMMKILVEDGFFGEVKTTRRLRRYIKSMRLSKEKSNV